MGEKAKEGERGGGGVLRGGEPAEERADEEREVREVIVDAIGIDWMSVERPDVGAA